MLIFLIELASKLTYAKQLSPCDCDPVILVCLLFLSRDISSHCGDISFHSQYQFTSWQCMKFLSEQDILTDPSETDKDICTPPTSTIIQHCLASLPVSSKLVYTSEAEFLKWSACPTRARLPELDLSHQREAVMWRSWMASRQRSSGNEINKYFEHLQCDPGCWAGSGSP